MTIKSHIRTVPHYPKQGIQFRDITTLLKDPAGFRATVDELVARYKDVKIDKIAGIESRGFILGAPLAYALNKGFIPIRKKGKLPAETIGHDYALEYGTDRIEIHTDAIQKGDRVLLADRENGWQDRRMLLHHRPAGHRRTRAAGEAWAQGVCVVRVRG
jgi:adenine phosphoribosyltransferase